MPTTKLDTTSALILIDLQKGVVSYPTAHPIGEVVKHAAQLADAFRNHGLPVVLVNVTGTPPGRTEQSFRVGDLPPGWADLVPELNQQPSDCLITKRTWGAFTNTGLEEQLKQLGVTQVVIGGVATSFGVDSTARQAHERGFHVTLAVDAMTDLNPEAHASTLARIFPRLGETGTTREIVELLDQRL